MLRVGIKLWLDFNQLPLKSKKKFPRTSNKRKHVLLSFESISHTPSFPTGLVKSESDFLVRLIQTDLGRWILVVAVIIADAYPFLAFWGLTCHLEDTEIGACTVPHDSKENELGSSHQEASLVLVPCHAWKCAPTVISGCVDISE